MLCKSDGRAPLEVLPKLLLYLFSLPQGQKGCAQYPRLLLCLIFNLLRAIQYAREHPQAELHVLLRYIVTNGIIQDERPIEYAVLAAGQVGHTGSNCRMRS